MVHLQIEYKREHIQLLVEDFDKLVLNLKIAQKKSEFKLCLTTKCGLESSRILSRVYVDDVPNN